MNAAPRIDPNLENEHALSPLGLADVVKYGLRDDLEEARAQASSSNANPLHATTHNATKCANKNTGITEENGHVHAACAGADVCDESSAVDTTAQQPPPLNNSGFEAYAMAKQASKQAAVGCDSVELEPPPDAWNRSPAGGGVPAQAGGGVVPAQAGVTALPPLEVDHQLSHGAAAMAVGAATRLRQRLRLRLGGAKLANHMGVVLILCSGVNVLTVTLVCVDESGELYAYMTNALSVSSFLLHVALTLAHDSVRPGCAAHFILLVLPTFINGAFHLARRDFASAAYLFFVWLLLLFPLLGRGLHRLLSATQQLDRATKDALSRSITIVMSSSMPVLYFLSNGMLCIAFQSESQCAIRGTVNHATILATVGNAILLIMLTLQPVSLKQMVSLDIPAPHLVAVSCAVIRWVAVLGSAVCGVYTQGLW